MKMYRREFLQSLGGVTLVASFGESQKEDAKSAVPDFTLPDIDGKYYRLSDYKHRVVLLDFWATWCEPCIDQIPELNIFRTIYEKDGLAVISVAVESGSLKNIRETAAKHDIAYPVLVGTDAVQNKFKIVGFPTTYLIGKPWRIHKKYVGLKSAKRTIEQDIQSLLSG